jgi:thiol-disulfide isomerase/thioredoxin
MIKHKYLLTVSCFVASVMLSGCMRSLDPMGVGTSAPSFNVSYVNDLSKSASLQSINGKVTLIDFWATWCGPCKQEIPELQKIYDDYHGKGLEAILISQEDQMKISSFASINNLTLPFYMDGDTSADRAFNVTGLPTTYVIGKDGKIVYANVGYGEGIEQELRQAIDRALAQ